MSDAEILLTGRPEPPDPPRSLRAGPLELELDGPDVRRVGYRGLEVAQQVFLAIRDGAWNTLPGVVDDLRVDEGAGNAFDVTYRSRHVLEELGVDLEAAGRITGTGDGELTYDVHLTAHAAIEYNRIGLNVFHGARTYAGRPYRSWLRGEERSGRLPVIVGPQPIVDGRLDGLLAPFDRLELSPVDGVVVELVLEGDEFETEDQRNFGDGTFKTYSTPLQRPAPFRLEAGETLRQAVRIRLRDDRPAAVVPARTARSTDGEVTVRIGDLVGRRLPPIGLGQAADDAPLSEAERARAVALKPHHVRVELVAADGVAAAEARVAAAAQTARSLDADLWVDLSAGAEDATVLEAIARAALTGEPVPSVIHLATTIAEPPDRGRSAEMLSAVRAVVASVAPATAVGVGSYMFYAELNRAPFDGAVVERLTFATCPTIHRADDATVLENVDRLADEVVTIRGSLGDRPLTIGPITLAARHGPYPDGPTRPGDLPPRVDARQVSLLAAALTVGHLAELAPAGVDALTFYETAGWMGVAERDDGSPMPDRFHSEPDTVFPLWHVLADAAEWRDGELRSIELAPAPTFTPTVAVLAVDVGSSRHLLVSSLVRAPQRVLVEGAGGATLWGRSLDVSSARRAMQDPAAFRAARANVHRDDGRVSLDLGPYATIRLDIE